MENETPLVSEKDSPPPSQPEEEKRWEEIALKLAQKIAADIGFRESTFGLILSAIRESHEHGK